MATLLLIDGHSQAYRAFFGVKSPLSTRSGEPTGAVFGFVRKLFSILKEYNPDHVAVAFDAGDTWRHAEFTDYKATRDAMPDEMRTQITRIESILRALNIPVVTYPDYEADDVLGTLAKLAAATDTEVLILTGDRDLFQLVDERVKILYTKGGPTPETVLYSLEEVASRYSLTPEQFIDLKALTGDASDNIPGVPGVGEKTAIKFLTQYGTIDELYVHIDEISGPKTRQNLIDARDIVERNRRLMRIVTDLDMVYDEEAFRLEGMDHEAVTKLFNELEFRTLQREMAGIAALTGGVGENASIADLDAADNGQMALFGALQQSAPDEPVALPETYRCIQDADALQALAEILENAQELSFDVETTSTDAMQAVLVGLGVSWEEGHAAYIPIAHHEGTQLPWETVRAALQPAFARTDLPKLAHNAKYDLTVCLRHGLEIAGPIHDTMVMAWLIDPASRTLGLKDQAGLELGWSMVEISEIIGSGRKQITIDAAPILRVAAYCGADVDATIRLYHILKPRVQEHGMWSLYERLEQPLVPILTDMEMAGVLLDVDFLGEMSKKLVQRLAELEHELFRLVGHEFNLRSTQQMSQVLFEELKFPTQGLKKTSSGHYSTAVGVLEQLAAQSEDLSDTQKQVLDIIFEQRQLEKLRGTYVDALPTLIHPTTGRVHTSFNQTGAVTGRMSSSNPNLQNIPIRTELGREVRRAFIAPEGWYLIAADYSQVELRVLAHVAQEPALIESFLADQDIHAATAARLFHVPIEDVDRTQRGLAKTINFATIYGVSEFGLSSRTDMTRAEARHFLTQYFETYPKIQAYIQNTIQQANDRGFVETLLGRKRFFPELNAGRLPHNQRQAVERAAINAPIQGTAADIIKLAMIELHGELKSRGAAARMLLQVHDELVLETPADELEATAQLVCDIMESAYTLNVPLKVDVEYGRNWYTLEPISFQKSQ
ncbi:MAG: DNA polymerase I [Litorilinea sp.]